MKLNTAPSASIDLSTAALPKLPSLAVMTTGLALMLSSCGESPSISSSPSSKDKTAEVTSSISFPSNFLMQEEWASIGTDFYLKDGDKKFAVVDQEVLNLTTTFEIRDDQERVAAKCSQSAFSWGVRIDVKDGYGNSIGSIEEKLFESFFKTMTSYEIKDQNGTLLATSDKLDFAGTTFTIKNPSGGIIATFDRSYFDIGGASWSCKFTDPGKTADQLKMICSLIPAYKTVADKKRKQASSKSKRRSSN